MQKLGEYPIAGPWSNPPINQLDAFGVHRLSAEPLDPHEKYICGPESPCMFPSLNRITSVLLLLVLVPCCTGPDKGVGQFTAWIKFQGQPPACLKGIAVDLVGDTRNYEPAYYLHRWTEQALDSILTEYVASGFDTLALSSFFEVNAGRYEISAWIWGLSNPSDTTSSFTLPFLKTFIRIQGDSSSDGLLFVGPWPAISDTDADEQPSISSVLISREKLPGKERIPLMRSNPPVNRSRFARRLPANR
jgi:hypothetical protein